MIKGIFGKDIYSGIDDDLGNVFVEMFYFCILFVNKEKIFFFF